MGTRIIMGLLGNLAEAIASPKSSLLFSESEDMKKLSLLYYLRLAGQLEFQTGIH